MDAMIETTFAVVPAGDTRSPTTETPYIVEVSNGWPLRLRVLEPVLGEPCPKGESSLVVVQVDDEATENPQLWRELCASCMHAIDGYVGTAEGAVVVDTGHTVLGVIPTMSLEDAVGAGNTERYAESQRLAGTPAQLVRCGTYQCPVDATHCTMTIRQKVSGHPSCPLCGHTLRRL